MWKASAAAGAVRATAPPAAARCLHPRAAAPRPASQHAPPLRGSSPGHGVCAAARGLGGGASGEGGCRRSEGGADGGRERKTDFSASL